MRIHGLTVSGNEKHRYLEACLTHNSKLLDTVFVFDDRSSDGSKRLAEKWATVVVRDHATPTMLERESTFRQAAWDSWESAMNPAMGDWVLTFDTDEFWYGPSLKSLIGDYTGGVVRRPEMWSYLNPLHRVDGQWSKITNVRFFPYIPGGKYKIRDLAGGSAPSYTEVPQKNLEGHLLHYGYADPKDRKERYSRYIGRPGHSKQHIRSIKSNNPKVEVYTEEWGDMPLVWRGMR